MLQLLLSSQSLSRRLYGIIDAFWIALHLQLFVEGLFKMSNTNGHNQTLYSNHILQREGKIQKNTWL